MEKFFNLMYDFFAFALPGVCIIGSIMLLSVDGDFLYCKFCNVFYSSPVYLLLVMIFAGYLVGYVVKPIAKYLLLKRISCLLYSNFLPMVMKKLTKTESVSNRCEDLDAYLGGENLSNDFILIREKAPKTAQYIEFWDMHITMSYNLAFASIIFFVVYLVDRTSEIHSILPWCPPAIILSIVAIAFFVLLRLSYFYTKWWCQDFEAARAYTTGKSSILHRNS